MNILVTSWSATQNQKNQNESIQGFWQSESTKHYNISHLLLGWVPHIKFSILGVVNSDWRSKSTIAHPRGAEGAKAEGWAIVVSEWGCTLTYPAGMSRRFPWTTRAVHKFLHTALLLCQETTNLYHSSLKTPLKTTLGMRGLVATCSIAEIHRFECPDFPSLICIESDSWLLGCSDTFANPRGCHCNLRPLYLPQKLSTDQVSPFLLYGMSHHFTACLPCQIGSFHSIIGWNDRPQPAGVAREIL